MNIEGKLCNGKEFGKDTDKSWWEWTQGKNPPQIKKLNSDFMHD